jgi:hypothetical protein
MTLIPSLGHNTVTADVFYLQAIFMKFTLIHPTIPPSTPFGALFILILRSFSTVHQIEACSNRILSFAGQRMEA